MNYYEHHIGDYIKDTAHLSMLEDSAYRRLIDAYYTREMPLPADRKACQKLARAQSKDERAAVDYILDEFFKLEDDGWHQSRCDAELAKYFAKQPEAEEKKENAKERQRKARERRKALFEELTNHGIHMPWNSTTEALQVELSRVTTTTGHEPVTRDNTCTHTPIPNPQSPCKPLTSGNVDSTGVVPGETQSAAVRFAVQVRAWEKARGKVIAMTATDPRVIAWADAGVTDEQLLFAYEMAVADREESADSSPINAGFLDVFVAKVLKPATSSSAIGKLPPAKPWFMSSTGIEEKAAELRIEKLSGEQWYQFRDRVYAASGVTAEMVRKAKIDAGEKV